MKFSQTWGVVLLNLLIGNFILAATVASNHSFSSLVPHSKLIFLTLFTAGSVASITACSLKAEYLQKQIFRIISALFVTIAPLLISSWLLVLYASLRAGHSGNVLWNLILNTLLALVEGHMYWLPCGIINYRILVELPGDIEKRELRVVAKGSSIGFAVIAVCFAVGAVLARFTT